MLSLSPPALLVLCLFVADSVLALRVPFVARSSVRSTITGSQHGLWPRENTTVSLKSVSNTQYLANITIGGAPFTVIIDTGSSDLWVSGNVPSRTDMGQSATVRYAVGQATGQISSAPVDFAGYSIPDQAFIYVQDPSSTGLDTNQFNGIIGLGPSISSQIRQKLNQAGDPFLDNVFRQNSSAPNFITILLNRVGDAEDTVPGQLTIGEIVPGFEPISSQPQVPVKPLPSVFQQSQHWSALIDEILGPDGQSIKLNSLVAGTPGGKLVTIVDTGFTLPQVPRDVSDAIYGRVQGANYDTNAGYWTVPCDQEVNVTIVIGGQKYPIHPLDTASMDILATASNGTRVCVGSFQPISTALDGSFDCVMGMSFLRNAYTYINYGNFIDGNPRNQSNPYLQLLSVTNATEAHRDFVKLRMNNVDTSGDNAHALLPVNEAKHSPSSAGEKAKNTFFRYWPWVVAALGLIIIVGVILLIFACCCRPRRRTQMGRFPGGSYKPLHESSSTTAMDMHAMGMPPKNTYADPYYNN